MITYDIYTPLPLDIVRKNDNASNVINNWHIQGFFLKMSDEFRLKNWYKTAMINVYSELIVGEMNSY